MQYRVIERGTDRIRYVDPSRMLASHQAKQLATQPDMILAFAHEIAEREPGDVAVYADVWVSINGRTPARLINPEIDLTHITNEWDRTSYVLEQPVSLDGGWILGSR